MKKPYFEDEEIINKVFDEMAYRAAGKLFSKDAFKSAKKNPKTIALLLVYGEKDRGEKITRADIPKTSADFENLTKALIEAIKSAKNDYVQPILSKKINFKTDRNTTTADFEGKESDLRRIQEIFKRAGKIFRIKGRYKPGSDETENGVYSVEIKMLGATGAPDLEM